MSKNIHDIIPKKYMHMGIEIPDEARIPSHTEITADMAIAWPSFKGYDVVQIPGEYILAPYDGGKPWHLRREVDRSVHDAFSKARIAEEACLGDLWILLTKTNRTSECDDSQIFVLGLALERELPLLVGKNKATRGQFKEKVHEWNASFYYHSFVQDRRDKRNFLPHSLSSHIWGLQIALGRGRIPFAVRIMKDLSSIVEENPYRNYVAVIGLNEARRNEVMQLAQLIKQRAQTLQAPYALIYEAVAAGVLQHLRAAGHYERSVYQEKICPHLQYLNQMLKSLSDHIPTLRKNKRSTLVDFYRLHGINPA
jgi:hypothetical protein